MRHEIFVLRLPSFRRKKKVFTVILQPQICQTVDLFKFDIKPPSSSPNEYACCLKTDKKALPSNLNQLAWVDFNEKTKFAI